MLSASEVRGYLKTRRFRRLKTAKQRRDRKPVRALLCRKPKLDGDYFSGLSSGAPVPDEPMKSFLPSGNVMSRPLARFAPSLAWKPSTRISVPSVSEFLFQPRRSNAFGAPPSTIQRSTFPVAGSFTSMWIQECGLIHSIFTTVPRSLTGRFASNSAAKEWCAETWTANTATNAAAAAMLKSFVRIEFISYLFGTSVQYCPTLD